MNKIELNIIALAKSESNKDNFVVVLEEEKGHRRLPIVIGPFEAQAIAIALERMQTNRPLTHDLFKSTLDQVGVNIHEVHISKLEEDVFHATLIGQKNDGTELKVDARSSDAIALAVRFGCPIFTNEGILNSAGILPDDQSQSFVHKRGDFSDYSIEELEGLLKQVLAKEDYESASKIRDAIQKKKGP